MGWFDGDLNRRVVRYIPFVILTSVFILPYSVFCIIQPFILANNGAILKEAIANGFPAENASSMLFTGNYFSIVGIIGIVALSIKNLYKSGRSVKFSIIALASFSYIIVIHLFAGLYLVILYHDPKSIVYDNPGAGMDEVTAYYFSLTTIATVGFGDIHPVTSIAKIIVMTEILVGLIYTVFVFSILAAAIRVPQQSQTS